MDTHRIAIDTFITEVFECKASVCAILAGAALSFQDIKLQTRRDKSDLHIIAGSTWLSIPLASILSIERQTFPDIHTIEYEISARDGGSITVDAF
jgi:hypothetical protein